MRMGRIVSIDVIFVRQGSKSYRNGSFVVSLLCYLIQTNYLENNYFSFDDFSRALSQWISSYFIQTIRVMKYIAKRFPTNSVIVTSFDILCKCSNHTHTFRHNQVKEIQWPNNAIELSKMSTKFLRWIVINNEHMAWIVSITATSADFHLISHGVRKSKKDGRKMLCKHFCFHLSLEKINFSSKSAKNIQRASWVYFFFLVIVVLLTFSFVSRKNKTCFVSVSLLLFFN